ncbi:MAG TPA: hypothetical protein DCR26_01205, partial [Porphyromonadaceae bacterium]|nr:hypothetical protein [Porphyromonadaceae bacterium]
MRTVAAFIAALAMIAAPVAEAQSRGRQSHTSGAAASQNAGKRPGSSANGATRPNRPSHGNNNSPSRPSTPPSGSNSRPTKPGN